MISNFIVQALRGEDITIYGNGNQTRSFCYVDDLIRGMVSMMDTDFYTCGPINLGNPGEFTILELAKIILEKTHSVSKIVYKKLPDDDPLQRRPNIDMAKKILKWEPSIDLGTGLSYTIDYFKYRL